MIYKNGSLVCFASWGHIYHGFIIGTCSYDNAGEDNAFVIRYVWHKNSDAPRKPYTIVRMDDVSPITNYDEEFNVGGHYSRTPEDRCNEWVMKEDNNSYLLVVPNKG